ncbi:clostripain-related cysteine peptidase [Neolewinella persica]|uniref:clostripain-related cysteine peptidase n=1 Tax=Neolewinella persica TaxID=70998 RepID=UPI000363A04A|nr:clostripain-related cysteine peptidase [Neolewinella persica]
MKQFYFTLLLAFAFVLPRQGFAQQAPKPWTFLVYLVGADLESRSNAATRDINEMLAVTNTSNVNVIVLTGGANKDDWRDIRAYQMANGVQTRIPYTPVGTDMANPQNLTNFVNWATQNYPAQKYGISLWNHGADIRGFGFDELSGNNFTIPTLKSAFAASTFIQGGGKFEVLGFDACLMATIEVAQSLQAFGKYMVVSEETEPGHGWDYTPIVQAMQNGSVTDGASLGRVIVDGFHAQAALFNTKGVTLSVLDMSGVDFLVTQLEALFQRIGQENKIRGLQRARGKSQEFSVNITRPEFSEDMVDIGDLLNKLLIEEPDLGGEIFFAQIGISSTINYERHDNTRPNATGMTMYLPHNKLGNDLYLNYSLNSQYNPIDFSTDIKGFLTNTYVPTAKMDRTPPSAAVVNGLFEPGGGTSQGRSSADVFSGIRITDPEDLEQIQIVLLEAFEGNPDEYIILGSTYPDTFALETDGSETYGYHWDEAWLGINGFPAYIADLQYFEYEDDNGDLVAFTQIQIPALLNPTEDSIGQEVIMTYAYDDDFNITLQSIIPTSTGADTALITAKERITLVPGDIIQLTYESFNDVTDEEFFVINDDAVFTIETGDEDLELEYYQLEAGDYFLGYILTDHSQNDTTIFDSRTFIVESLATKPNFIDNGIEMFPNPANQVLTIENTNFNGQPYQISLYDLMGRQVYAGTFNQPVAQITTSTIASGYYAVKLSVGNRVFSDRVILRH